MRYAYHDLGKRGEGDTVLVRWHGAAADVMLVDPVNFAKYYEGRKPVIYSAGGRYGRPPARLTVPQDGRWYVVADLRGHSSHPDATVEVVGRDGAHQQEENEEALVELG
jgi:hypothetical protein